MDQLQNYLRERIDAADFPSAVYLAAEKGEIVLHGAIGFAVVEPEKIEARTDTIYDLASLTKPLVTGLLIAKLAEDGKFPLDARVSIYLKEFDIEGKRAITILDLLTHKSGLPGWKPYYLCAAGTSSITSEIGKTPLEFTEGAVIYGDPNFIALGMLIERITGKSLDASTREILLEPLSLRDTFFNPPKGLKERIAASEKGNGFEKQLSIEGDFLQPPATAVDSDPFRDYQIWGEVHDGNAYFMGGVGGHAGLFSTAEEVFRIAQQFLPETSTLLKPKTCELFHTNFTPDTNEHRSLGFQIASTPGSTAGTKMSRTSFGHNGFTGTSLWIDAEKERIFILLTNRTHNRGLPFANINGVRRRFHDLAVDYLVRKS